MQVGIEKKHPATISSIREEVFSTRLQFYTKGKKMKKYKCILCDFEYDEAAGLPDEGIAAGTRWEDVSDEWTCPDCGASKSDFDMIEV
jgi:rubredoxin